MKKLVNYYHIVLYLHRMTITDLIALANGIKTLGDPDVTFVSYTDVQLKTLANIILVELGNRLTLPNPVLTAQEQIDINALCVAITAVSRDVERQANAKALGNRLIFETVIKRIGFHSGKPHGKHIHIAEFLAAEKRSFDFRATSEGEKKEHVVVTYLWGLSPAENVLPLVENQVSLQYNELIVTGLPDTAVYVCMRYAVQLPSLTGKRGKTPAGGLLAATERGLVAPSSVAVRLPTNKNGKISLAYGTTYLHFSNPMYYRIP